MESILRNIWMILVLIFSVGLATNPVSLIDPKEYFANFTPLFWMIGVVGLVLFCIKF